jgi:hypothetical protein
MRHIIGLILAGFGAFLILVAILLPTWVVGQILEFPLSEYETATLAASNASYFNASTLSEKTGVTMLATYTIKGDASKGSSSTAVWNLFTDVYDQTNKYTVQEMTRTFAFNRRNGQLVDCCGANVNGDSSVRQTGYVGYVFTIGTQKQTYQVFNTTLKKMVPYVYSGTANVNGIQAYKFIENVPPTQTGTQAVPGSFVGSAAASVTLGEFDTEHVIYYVDPETGALIDVNEQQSTTLRTSATAAPSLVLFDANLIATPATVKEVAGLDNSGRNKLTLLKTTLPLVLGIVGAIALLAGIFLSRRPHDDVAAPDPVAREATLADSGQAVVPGMADEPAELAAEAPEGEEPDTSDSRSTR